MKPSFHSRLLNSPFEDPGLYVRVLREGRAFLFDLGCTVNLSSRDILKITDIFVSHTHVDHFIGFDNVLRTCLNKNGVLRLYGPEGFIGRTEARLESYTWNLTEEYPLIIEAMEVKEKKTRKARFRAAAFFRREDLGSASFEGVLMKDHLCKVSSVILDHKIPCLAFSIEEDYHINIDKAKLVQMNLPVGPWLGELKRAVRENRKGVCLKAGDRHLDMDKLRDVVNIARGQKMAYVVDALGSQENIEKIIELARGSDVLYIEACFADKDREKAAERYHLTAKEAGRIARKADAGRLEVFHFSPRYIHEPQRLVKEAEEEFKKIQE